MPSLFLPANPWPSPGLLAKPSDGFAQARLNSKCPPKRAKLMNGTWAKTSFGVIKAG
jgi:hypothetical protein